MRSSAFKLNTHFKNDENQSHSLQDIMQYHWTELFKSTGLMMANVCETDYSY